jgi:mycothiol synthase
MTEGMTITVVSRLTPVEVASVLRVVSSAEPVDGSSALNEAALLHLRHERDGIVHFLAGHRDGLAGYAQLADQDAVSIGELVVSPEHRRRGIGSQLLTALLQGSRSPLRIWAMGDSAAARGLAAKHGLVRARELLIMTRSLAGPVPEAPLPAKTSIRPFVVGQDEDEWLAVNHRAFCQHPEQGRLTRADLDDRTAETWFDPTGFFVAVRDGRMVGFHWTKQHPNRLGEVYVLGVEPSAGGHGLGKALLSRGLKHLQRAGNELVELYVEADHERAIALYAGRGFSVSSRDVMYAQP